MNDGARPSPTRWNRRPASNSRDRSGSKPVSSTRTKSNPEAWPAVRSADRVSSVPVGEMIAPGYGDLRTVHGKPGRLCDRRDLVAEFAGLFFGDAGNPPRASPASAAGRTDGPDRGLHRLQILNSCAQRTMQIRAQSIPPGKSLYKIGSAIGCPASGWPAGRSACPSPIAPDHAPDRPQGRPGQAPPSLRP